MSIEAHSSSIVDVAVLKTGFEFEKQLAAAIDRELAQVFSDDGKDGEFPVAEADDSDATDGYAAESDNTTDVDAPEQTQTDGTKTPPHPVAILSSPFPGGSQHHPPEPSSSLPKVEPASKRRKQHGRDAKRARRAAKRELEKQKRDKTEYVHRPSQSKKFARGKRLRANRFNVDSLPTTSNGFTSMNQTTGERVRTADELLQEGIRLQKWDGV